VWSLAFFYPVAPSENYPSINSPPTPLRNIPPLDCDDDRFVCCVDVFLTKKKRRPAAAAAANCRTILMLGRSFYISHYCVCLCLFCLSFHYPLPSFLPPSLPFARLIKAKLSDFLNFIFSLFSRTNSETFKNK
jgi:hypothetical protein